MNDYDFSTLNDKEFENLTIDLISKDRGKRFERFKAGRDGGIDGRYYGEDGKQEIIQCKHYLRTGYNGLISSLKRKNKGKTEADKVKLLDPQRYIFITSLPLSASNKKEIREIFEPYIKKDSDIYGQEDLNDLLKASPNIEESHYKLWISSTSVLKRIFNNAIKGRSEFLFEEIHNKIKYYVMTENHNRAIEKLKSSHTIIIAGEPGIGKTTLAEQIALNYIEKGFEFCIIARDISEAEDIFERNKKQIFYFDDFLGSNYLNTLEAHTDSHIMQFITRIKQDKNKRFILTSRTNIMNQAISLSDTFKYQNINENEFILNINEFSDNKKENILYNHIWHSNLEEKYKQILYQKQSSIIWHKNFNPRLIAFIVNAKDIKDNITDISYWEYVINNLNNPKEIWTNAFDKQSDEHIRSIVCLTVFSGNKIEETKLNDAYDKLELINNSHTSKDFSSVVKDTLRFFLNRNIVIKHTNIYKKEKLVDYTLFNPSIADFIINRYINDESKLLLYFSSLQTLNSLDLLQTLYKNFKLTKKLYNKIIIKSFKKSNFIVKENNEIYFNTKRGSYLSKIIHMMIDNNLFNEFIKKSRKKIKVDSYKIDVYFFIELLCQFSSPNLKEINNIIKLSSSLDFEENTTIDDLSDLVNQYLKHELKSSVEYEIDNLNPKYINFEDHYYLPTPLEEDSDYPDLQKYIVVSHPIDTEKILDKLIEKLNISSLYDLDKDVILESIEDYFIDNRIIENEKDNGNPFFYDDDNDEFLYY